MRLRFLMINLLLAIVIISLPAVNALGQSATDLVQGNLIQFNDNGAWCWYQDERAVVDTLEGTLILGSDACSRGVGGSPRNGDINGIIFDFHTGLSHRITLKEGGVLGCDDHDAPAFLVLPNGNYLAVYAGHNNNNYSYFRIYQSGQWESENYFDWNTMPGGTNFATTYSNLFYMSTEGKIYDIARSDNRSPNMFVSTDLGQTWSYGGLLTEPDVSIGYVNGYFKYWGNGIDRIDFIGTEHHPRDYNTSVYHGYIQNGQSFNSEGTLLDNDITDQTAPKPADFTPVFLANTVIDGDTMRKIWDADLVHYDDGTIAAILTCRINNAVNGNDNNIDPDHALIYARYDQENWSYTYLGQAGKKMYSSEADYTGLGALDPNDPNTIYISTHVDPRTDIDITYREIFKGETSDNGASWSWTPVTQNSNEHNFRPIVPKWNEHNTALLWFRGTYNAAQNFDAAIVGILDGPDNIHTLMSYVDATLSNTLQADGSALVTTGPDPNQGPADNQWHIRTGFGNGGSVLASAEAGGENAPALKTRIEIPEAGSYKIWVNFWANPNADWRIRAGLSESEMRIFRQMASKQVENGDHDSTLVLSGGGNTFMYQAYIGRINALANDTVEVFVDDYAVQTGTTGTLVGDVARTWYDGLSYARLDSSVVSGIKNKKQYIPADFQVSQNYPNPFNPSTTIRYTLSKNVQVSIKIYDLLGQEITTLIDKIMPAGIHSVSWNGQKFPSGMYFYKMTVGNHSEIKKMMLLR